MNLSELESDDTRLSDNPQLEDHDEEEETLMINLAQTTTTPQNPENSGKTKRKRTERKEFYDVSEKYTKLASPSSDRSGKNKGHKKHRGDENATHLQPKSPAMIRAEELQLNLEPELPSFIKSMVRSHVTICFWMGLPGPFARKHLPHEVTSVTLEAENGAISDVKYIANKTGLSKGWRQFVIAQHLLEGDVLIFQLTGPRCFKSSYVICIRRHFKEELECVGVFIIRACELSAVDGALGLLSLEAQTKHNDAETASAPRKSTKKKKKQKFLPLAVVQNSTSDSKQSENDSEVVGYEVMEGYKLATPTFQFDDVKSFNDFVIFIDGSLVDSELQENIRKKYYDLCRSQNAFLHENIAPGMIHNLIIGTIWETVNIADALRNCKLTTSRDKFSGWENSLKAFELLGMNVGFLVARLNKLVKLAFESEGGSSTRGYVEAKTEKNRAEEEIKGLEAKVKKLKKVSGKCEAEIESLKPEADGYEVKF
ncbi:hypothetical protein ACFE04_022484 [Oxalis oulophora]